MNTFATITLAHHGLEFRCPAANISEDRKLTDDDCLRFQGWAERYLKAAGKDDHHDALLELGGQMHEWLNGPTSFLTRAIETAVAPLIIEFGVSRQDCETDMAKAFLDAPWELLTSDGQFWALDPTKVFCPIRRIGNAVAPPPPSPHRLGLVFMAAAPRGTVDLNYEAEEASILTATDNIGLGIDLTVEESGTLELLSACVAREKPDIVQISCHGELKPNPGLWLEDAVGDKDFVEAKKLIIKIAAQHPRLLFLSACETTKADPVLPSLARSLVLAGTSAVLGWAAPVRDNEATLFAALFYNSLAKGDDLTHGLAYARLELADHDKLPEPDAPGPRSRDWHLARLFLSSSGGGALATADGDHRRLGHGQAVKTFLDAKGKQVPVAGEQEFVGRRRDIQKILRAFRAPASARYTGVFIHGVGRQGKSSLAARVAHRLENSHETVVIFGRYDAPYILRTIGERIAVPAVTEIVDHHMAAVEADKAKLLPALTELLRGPLAQKGKNGAKPMLLIIDDFEQALDDENHSTLKPEYFDSIRRLLLAFGAAATESHLLFTSRFQFTCPHDGKDLADDKHLLHVALHGMNDREARKQAGAKLRVPEVARFVTKLSAKNRGALEKRLARIITNACGNPGLQDLLFTLALQEPTACDRCLTDMEGFLQSGKLPEEDKIREFLEKLALQSLTGLLTPAQRELLRAATLFELPVPVTVMEKLAEKAGLGNSSDIVRLVALGLWEIYEDLYDTQTMALAVNALVQPLAGTLNDLEKEALSEVAAGLLFDQWGGEEGNKQRGYRQDFELTRLGLLAQDAHVLAATAADALRFLDSQFKYRQAAAWAKEILTIVDAAGMKASVNLLRTAAERCQQVGDVAEANTFRDRAIALIEQGGEVDTEDQAFTFITYARALVDQGQQDEALQYLEQAKQLLPPGREQAIVMGDIAHIRKSKGDVDVALQLFQEVLHICEELADKKGLAVTLGNIAQIWANKGEWNTALQLYRKALNIFEVLEDKRERAVALANMAKILDNMDAVSDALQKFEEAHDVFLILGDKSSQAKVLDDIARIRANKGEKDTALLLYRKALNIFEALDEKRSCAVTLGDIARIQADTGAVDTALQLYRKVLDIFESLEDLDGKANTFWSIAQIKLQQEKWQDAYDYLSESYEILIKLNRLDGISWVGLDFGQLLCMTGQNKKGLAILTRSRYGFSKLGQDRKVQQTQALLDKIAQAPPKVERQIFGD